MIKQIRELAGQAGFGIAGEPEYIYAVDYDGICSDELQKFAILLVREVLNICYRNDTEYEGKKVRATLIADKVAKYFEVEQ